MPTTILCIDDDSANLDVRRELLQRAGYRVLTAKSGGEALDTFSSEAVDAVVLDYWLPGTNGIKVATEFKSLKPHVPMTGWSFCTKASERVYITASGCEIEFGETREL
jgi:CheY-like chemotaxis protein